MNDYRDRTMPTTAEGRATQMISTSWVVAPVVVRRAEPEDLASLRSLFVEFAEDDPAQHSDPTLLRPVVRAILPDPPHHLCVGCSAVSLPAPPSCAWFRI
jgi:hypothetical protein